MPNFRSLGQMRVRLWRKIQEKKCSKKVHFFSFRNLMHHIELQFRSIQLPWFQLMQRNHAAIFKDKNRVIGPFNVVEIDSGNQRHEHGKSAFYDVNVSHCPNTHQCHKSKSVEIFHLIGVKNDATGSLLGVLGKKMRNTT